MSYKEYVSRDYKPARTDIICEFNFKPAKGVSVLDAAGGIAAESSVGTWDKVMTETKKVSNMRAIAYYVRKNIVRIAYPLELFEPGNISQLLSSVAGNVFGMDILNSLLLKDIIFPKNYVKSFKGPRHGINGLRKKFKIYDRPLIGTIIKPKIGLSSSQHAKIAFKAWVGGCDIVKDDENLTNQDFNPFKLRVNKTLALMRKAEQLTGEKKAYLANVTAPYDEMLKRVKYVEKAGGTHIMIDVLTVGWSALQEIRKHTKLPIHAHRAMHAAMTRSEDFGMSMKVIAKLCRLIGVDQLHTGGILGKMSESKNEVLETVEAITSKKNDLGMLKQVMPVASGGLYPGVVEKLVKILGKDVIIQAGGGIHGHPRGTEAGAKAMRQALHAAIERIPLKRYAETHEELKEAIKKWGVKK